MSFAKKVKKISNLLSGLGMIFVGLKLMSDACNDESIKGSFEEVLSKIDFPLLLEFLGVIFTAIIQSSSAMTGIVIVMVGNKVMNMNNGLFITLGANVGTCVTALIGIIGANINSKRTAVIHLTFNICGCLLFTPILWIFNKPILNILKSIVSKEPMQIAYFHLFFNCTTALITTPLIEYLVKIAKFIVKDDQKEDEVIGNLIKDEKYMPINPRDITNNINEEENKEEKDGLLLKKDGEKKEYEPPIYLNEKKENEKDEEKIDIKEDSKEDKKEEEKKENKEKEEEKKEKQDEDEKIEVKKDE
jgi:hypothetical protein